MDEMVENERKSVKPKTYLTMSGTNWQNSQVSVCACPQPLPNKAGFLFFALDDYSAILIIE